MRYGSQQKPPALATSCDSPALALSTATTTRGMPLRWTAVGPPDAVVIAIDVARLDAGLTATPVPGATEPQVVPIRTPLKGCKATGVLGVQVPVGAHTVSVFPATGGAPLASKPLMVTER